MAEKLGLSQGLDDQHDPSHGDPQTSATESDRVRSRQGYGEVGGVVDGGGLVSRS